MASAEKLGIFYGDCRGNGGDLDARETLFDCAAQYFYLQAAYVASRPKKLTIEVAQLDVIMIHEGHRLDARAGYVQCRQGTNSAAA